MISQKPFPWATYEGMHAWCRVCGTSTLLGPDQLNGDAARCCQHRGRNPCSIDGCKRSTKAPDSGELSLDEWLCSEHWRAFVPPRSPERRVYHRHFRLANKYGWTAKRRRAFWRCWRWIVAKARARAAGDIDMDEINRAMGWD